MRHSPSMWGVEEEDAVRTRKVPPKQPRLATYVRGKSNQRKKSACADVIDTSLPSNPGLAQQIPSQSIGFPATVGRFATHMYPTIRCWVTSQRGPIITTAATGLCMQRKWGITRWLAKELETTFFCLPWSIFRKAVKR